MAICLIKVVTICETSQICLPLNNHAYMGPDLGGGGGNTVGCQWSMMSI